MIVTNLRRYRYECEGIQYRYTYFLITYFIWSGLEEKNMRNVCCFMWWEGWAIITRGAENESNV